MDKSKIKNFEKEKELFELACAQGGYFTTKQAEAHGFYRQNHRRLEGVKWEKVARGIYRHKLCASSSSFDELHILRLYFLRRDGTEGIIYSGETAALLMGVGDFLPIRIYGLIESDARRSTQPPFSVTLRRVPSFDTIDSTQSDEGLPVTTPMQTLLDLLTTYDKDPEEVRRAYVRARNEGKITKKKVDQNLRRKDDADILKLFALWEESL
ncbi:MAG TPA: type IV toxin-antitoxin system AbiEi family antitoxin domain-containing protein [Oligoflexus sp.]|uniref:type IV toxin-antitoxin system AbiEi family antitoxin domain-containing protein n=1 Tax=Oligoflexus sp. TaxID=1971216 RepID=UPI002D4092E0|nr:type IV toxin-antitoxin system AbiEi family antitoxin domain-containing protein [Oligoflexus sp.]HYX35760.1 type IV toxin-antitoxin system AbiEi family antitoxin domain-containing protein [Oligoflexus sp.]